MRNTLEDLNNALFAELENLQDEDIDDAEMERRMRRSEAVAKVADKIIHNADLTLKAVKYRDEMGYDGARKSIPMLQDK